MDRLRELWQSITLDQRREAIGAVMGPITVSRAGGVLDPPLHRKPTTRELFAARSTGRSLAPSGSPSHLPDQAQCSGVRTSPPIEAAAPRHR